MLGENKDVALVVRLVKNFRQFVVLMIDEKPAGVLVPRCQAAENYCAEQPAIQL